NKLKMKTEEILNYERSLVRFYEQYVQLLRRLILSGLGVEKSSTFYYSMLSTAVARRRLAEAGCRCLGQLLSTHYNFNHRVAVIELMARVLCNSHSRGPMRTIAYRSFRQLLGRDLLDEATLETVKHLTSQIAVHNHCVTPLAFKLFLHLIYPETSSQSQSLASGGKSEEMRAMSRKQR